MSAIELIRAEVANLREEHSQRIVQRTLESPGQWLKEIVCSPCDDASSDSIYWPCPILQLAENYLKLAEALLVVRDRAGTHTIAAHPYYTKPTDDPSFGGIYAVADEALSEVATAHGFRRAS